MTLCPGAPVQVPSHDINVVVEHGAMRVSNPSSRRQIADTVKPVGMAARTNLHVLMLVVSVGLTGAACFDSDELRSSDEASTTSGSETVAVYNDDTADSSDDNWTAEETGPGETTCRDAIDCLVTCQTLQFLNPMDEPDLSCFLECDKDLTTEEAYKLIKLAECIGNKCAVDPDGVGPELPPCGPDSSDNACLTCIAGNAQDPQPEGCIEEAAACE